MGETSAAGSADPATILCTSCGLCCMGALHHSVLLLDEEADNARALGLEVGKEGRTVFALPCPRLEGTRCGAYARRPTSCGFYRCQLLRDLDQGRIGLDDALGKVRVARTQLAEVQALMPAGMTLRRARAIATGRGSDAEATPELRLRVTALTYYLDRHFMNDDDGKYFIVTDISPAGEQR